MAGPMGELVVISGRYRGHRIPLTQEVFRIGRDRNCQMALDDESASRVHSEIVCDGNHFVLRDLRSTNGTFLNDAKISESPLQNGDRIGVGDTILLLQIAQTNQVQTQVVFDKDQPLASKRYSLSLDNTHFLQLQDGASIPDAQRQFSILYEFMADIAGILHRPAVLERALAHFFTAFQPDRGLILLLTPEGEPGVKVTRIREGVSEGADIRISRTMAQQLLEKKESFLSLNAALDERLSESESLHGMNVYSLMGAPLKVKDKVLGMLYFDTLTPRTQFCEQDLKLCTAMALQLAVCLENTRLYSELLDASEFNHAVMRSLKSAIVVVDNSARVIRVNDATYEILKKPESQLLGRSLGEFIECAELHRVVQTTLTTGRSEDRSEVLVRVGSENVPLGLSVTVLTDHSSRVIGAVANFRNMAQIRKLEEQVRRTQHLAALGQMAAGVAHEIRNPLNTIRGFAQLLQENPAGSPKQNEFCQIILEEVDRMNRIVQDLLDYSRQRELTLVSMKIEKVLEDLIRNMTPEAETAKVGLELKSNSAPMPILLGNDDKLRQVFRNLILNGLQACKAGGRVNVSFYAVDEPPLMLPGLKNLESKNPNHLPPQKQIAIVVEDNGCGMEPMVMQRVFEPFFTRKDTGSGLGLSISHKIIEQHGGRIEVKSEPGKGSMFTVFVPAV